MGFREFEGIPWMKRGSEIEKRMKHEWGPGKERNPMDEGNSIDIK
jgi:hypothetical protein